MRNVFVLRITSKPVSVVDDVDVDVVEQETELPMVISEDDDEGGGGCDEIYVC